MIPLPESAVNSSDEESLYRENVKLEELEADALSISQRRNNSSEMDSMSSAERIGTQAQSSGSSTITLNPDSKPNRLHPPKSGKGVSHPRSSTETVIFLNREEDLTSLSDDSDVEMSKSPFWSGRSLVSCYVRPSDPHRPGDERLACRVPQSMPRPCTVTPS